MHFAGSFRSIRLPWLGSVALIRALLGDVRIVEDSSIVRFKCTTCGLITATEGYPIATPKTDRKAPKEDQIIDPDFNLYPASARGGRDGAKAGSLCSRCGGNGFEVIP